MLPPMLMSTEYVPSSSWAPYRVHSSSPKVVGYIRMVVASDRSSSNTCTSSPVIHEAGTPWGSTNVNETGSQAGSPVRANETSRLAMVTSGEMLREIPPPRSFWVASGRGGVGVAVGKGVGVGCCGTGVAVGCAVGCGVAVGGTGVAVGVGAVVAVGVGAGEGAIAVGWTGTGDRTTLGGGVLVGTTAAAIAGIGAVAGASSSTDSEQAVTARRITAAAAKAVVSFKG